MAAGFRLDAKDGGRLLKVKTHSYHEVDQAHGKFPLIIYMAGYNGMGIKLNVNKKPNFVEAFHFHVSYNRFSAKSFFR